MPSILRMPVAPEIIAEAEAIRSNRVMMRDIEAHLLLTPHDEAGGFILFKENRMRFVATVNSVQAPLRGGLFEPDDADMFKVWELNDQGWDIVASVHSHPTFAPYPSNIDATQLFPNQRVNIIWSFLSGGIARFYDCRSVDLFPEKKQKGTPLLWAYAPSRV